jgi:hypothetical protein
LLCKAEAIVKGVLWSGLARRLVAQLSVV